MVFLIIMLIVCGIGLLLLCDYIEAKTGSKEKGKAIWILGVITLCLIFSPIAIALQDSDKKSSSTYKYSSSSYNSGSYSSSSSSSNKKKSSGSSSSTSKKSSGSSYSKTDNYDSGYNSVYYDDDYDRNRYDSDPDYASGVDDAMEDADW